MTNYIIIAVIFVAVALVLFYGYRHQCLLRERAQIMRDAIRHRDFSFRLPTRGLFFGEKALQETLNDMGQEIQKLVAHSEVESWQKLTRVLTHEIMNAIEAEAKSFSLAPPKGGRGGTFSNDGHVIPLDEQQEIFIPFFTTKPTGTGIGLSHSRQILMKQGMTLSLAESPQRGYDVTFIIEKC